APRLRQVEDLLGAALRVKLAADLAAVLKRSEDAAAALPEGARPPVRVARLAVSALHSFHPREEGGIGKTPQMVVDIPVEFWPRVLEVGGEQQQQLQSFFVRPFIDLALTTRMPREEYLRGRFIYLGKPSNPDQARMPLEQSAESSSDPGVSGFG